MWKDYSADFIKNNRASSMTIFAAAFISTLFLSLICALFYNFWVYEVEQVILKEGDWQGRITGSTYNMDLTSIQNFANVESAVINEELSDGQTMTVDVYFQNTRRIFRDLPLITANLGLQEDAASYHLLLLSKYLIHDPQDPEPPLLLTLYLVILFFVSISLILIIHNSFAVSMDARAHQFGIFSSIGATPGQIHTCLMQEAAALSTVPILAGSLFGIFLSYGTIQAIDFFARDAAGRHTAVWSYHPCVFAVTILASAVTVLISAWLPARRISKLTPLQVIRNAGEFQPEKKYYPRILSLLFGVEGELSGNSLNAHRKALRTSTLSLTFSFLAFTWMLSFFTLTGISTNHTYFERYRDAWDVMVTVKDTDIKDFSFIDELQSALEESNVAVYQKASATSRIPASWQSDSLVDLNGLGTLTGTSVTEGEGDFTVKTPIVILDDRSFQEYCNQIGIAAGLDGTIILNRIWDSLNSNYRYKQYIPYLNEKQNIITLQGSGKEENSVKLPILGFAQEVPALREEYDNYALVQFISLSQWNKISVQLTEAEPDTYIRVLAKDNAALHDLHSIEADISRLLRHGYVTESENRIQEKISDEKMQKGIKTILGSFCVLLATIGIANIFSYTLGFLHQRKREFAQYLSVGITPGGIKKMFFIEALVISGRPLLITLPITVAAAAYFIKASYLNPAEFLAKAPIIPILIFVLAVFSAVASAYYIGGKRVLKYNLMEALKREKMI